MPQTKLQRLLENGEKEAASRLIYQYIEVTKQLLTADMLDVDLIFPNILVDGDTWNIIDYEWTFTEKIPGKWILYRAMFYLAVQLPGYEQTRLDALLKLAGITDDEALQFENWEVDFQEYLRRDTRPIGHMVDLLGNEVIPFDGTAEKNERECVRRLNLSGRDAKKLFYHIDRAELKDGKAVVSGWVCAKTRKKEFLPADIRLFDESGEPAGRAVHRTMRSDVAEVLKAPNDFPCWGFDFSWSVRTDKRYTLCFSAGRCQQEILLNEIWERN